MGYVAGFWLVAGMVLWFVSFGLICVRFNASNIDIGIGATCTVAVLMIAALITIKVHG